MCFGNRWEKKQWFLGDKYGEIYDPFAAVMVLVPTSGRVLYLSLSCSMQTLPQSLQFLNK